MNVANMNSLRQELEQQFALLPEAYLHVVTVLVSVVQILSRK
jgi:hypothetical protein